MWDAIDGKPALERAVLETGESPAAGSMVM
jgi:hypothetical protein